LNDFIKPANIMMIFSGLLKNHELLLFYFMRWKILKIR